MTPYTRHLRGAIGTRENFDWSANGDGPRELEPVFAEELQRQPLAGATVPLWIYPATTVFAFLAIILWSHS